LIANKWKALEESHCLKALVKLVTELHRAELEACHYTEEFILWRIHPLGHKEKLAIKCP
jgi:hypothetical protein